MASNNRFIEVTHKRGVVETKIIVRIENLPRLQLPSLRYVLNHIPDTFVDDGDTITFKEIK